MLGFRIVWATVMLLSALLTAKLMLRYFNPWISFAGPALALAFPSHIAVKILDYNTTAVVFLILGAMLWTSAYRQKGKYQILLAAAAGMTSFLATTCRIPVVAICLLPIVTVAYDYICGVKAEGRLQVVLAFMAAYLTGLVIFFVTLYANGLAGNFIATFSSHADSALHSPQEMIDNLVYSGYYYLVPALLISGLLLIKRLRSITALNGKYRVIIAYGLTFALTSFVAITIINLDIVQEAILQLVADTRQALNGPYYGGERARLVILAFAVGIVIADVIFNIFDSLANRVSAIAHDRCRMGVVALFLASLMIPGTQATPAYNINCMSWLIISMAVGVLWLWITNLAVSKSKKGYLWASKLGFVALLLLVFCYRVSYNRSPFRDSDIWNLNTVPATTKLWGIYTTEDRAQTIDLLVQAVKLNSQPGDRILTYENLPMLYYLTDRLPATNATWVTESFPRPFRERLFEDMVNRGRIPKLVVRATYTTRDANWPTSKSALYWKSGDQETDPINKYVNENYRVIQEIDGFQIMLPIDYGNLNDKY